MKQIETKRLILKPMELSDASFILEHINTEDWKRYIADRNVKTIKEAENYIRNRYLQNGKQVYAVWLKEENKAIGTAGLYTRDGLELKDLGYSISPDYYRNGYAFEASEALIDFAKEDLGEEQLCAITATYNQASQQLLKKLGFAQQPNINIPEVEEELCYFLLPL